MPKTAVRHVTSNSTAAIWYNMRGYSQSNTEWPKADQVEKMWTNESCPAFCPPALPKQLPLDTQVTKSDARAVKRQKSYAAPAHVVSHLMDSLSEGALLPLARAAAANKDPFVEEQLAAVHEFLSGQTAYQLGLAVRSLAASYNVNSSNVKKHICAARRQKSIGRYKTTSPGFKASSQKTSLRLLPLLHRQHR
jgi:hypothetical protein